VAQKYYHGITRKLFATGSNATISMWSAKT
jgi:hypothetical protein